MGFPRGEGTKIFLLSALLFHRETEHPVSRGQDASRRKLLRTERVGGGLTSEVSAAGSGGGSLCSTAGLEDPAAETCVPCFTLHSKDIGFLFHKSLRTPAIENTSPNFCFCRPQNRVCFGAMLFYFSFSLRVPRCKMPVRDITVGMAMSSTPSDQQI